MAEYPPSWALDAADVNEEEVWTWIQGHSALTGGEWRPPVLMVTDSEVIWANKGMFRSKAHRITRTSVSSIAYSKGLLHDTMTVNVAGGDAADTSIKLSRGERGVAESIMSVLREPLEALSHPSPESTSAAEDVPDQIRKLAELRDAGILTDKEFDSKKSELLARM